MERRWIPGPTCASFGRRFAAGLIDAILWYACALCCAIAMAVFRPIREDMSESVKELIAFAWTAFAFIAPLLLIRILPPTRESSSPGQYILGLRLVRWPDLNAVGFFASSLVAVVSFVALPITVICVFWGSDSDRLWYDNLVGVAVVRLEPRGPDSHTLCRHCGYDLTGNTSGTCPECGGRA